MLRKSFLALDVSLSMRAQLQQTAWLLHTCTVWRRAKQSTGEASTQKYSPNKLQRLLYKEYLRTVAADAEEVQALMDNCVREAVEGTLYVDQQEHHEVTAGLGVPQGEHHVSDRVRSAPPPPEARLLVCQKAASTGHPVQSCQGHGLHHLAGSGEHRPSQGRNQPGGARQCHGRQVGTARSS
ncbi:uncharacterized protein LOC142592718 isoform X1 [Dermacentor variabilis]|uniref:uncharacterized protein LOC142592718 isoform X1 n=1 Tax=Dermacentor variabilis TaxID=34621 RepID=UPI003F5BD5A3